MIAPPIKKKPHLQNVVITKDEEIINKMIEDGWFVKSVTPQYVSVAAGTRLETELGLFCFVMERL